MSWTGGESEGGKGGPGGPGGAGVRGGDIFSVTPLTILHSTASM